MLITLQHLAMLSCCYTNTTMHSPAHSCIWVYKIHIRKQTMKMKSQTNKQINKHSNIYNKAQKEIFIAHSFTCPTLALITWTWTSFSQFDSRSLDLSRKHHLITLTPDAVSRIIWVHRSRPCIDPLEADQHLQLTFSQLLCDDFASKWKQATIKSFLFKLMQWSRPCALAWIYTCVCTCISYVHLSVWEVTECAPERHTRRLGCNRMQKAVQALKRGYGWVCAVHDCNQLQSVGAARSNQRHKCQLLSPAHASICIH